MLKKKEDTYFEVKMLHVLGPYRGPDPRQGDVSETKSKIIFQVSVLQKVLHL